MTPEEVLEERSRIEEQAARGQAVVESAHAALRALQRICKHPNEFRTSHMGESCLHCPDCGHCP